MTTLPTDHFLSLPRPDVNIGPPQGVVDTTTLAAHDFDVDNRTGFMPSAVPMPRLPREWEAWEATLDHAIAAKLQLGEKHDLTDEDASKSEAWRASVRALPVLSISNLTDSEVALRRGHHVLAWIMHFYIQTLPTTAPVVIPRPITIPHLQICAQLQLPPVLTYSDDVLYNWDLKEPSQAPVPALDNLRSQTLFTGTNDEQEFYLASSRIELRGVEALDLMRATMDEAFVGDAIAIRRITGYLHRMAVVIGELKTLLLAVREGCDPRTFYRDIRPWFRGQDSDPLKRPWVFEGLEEDPTLKAPTELSGPSAGQSALVHALDVFLGVDKYTHETPADPSQRSFLDRMRVYMPRHHRAFLAHLGANTRPLRSLVLAQGDPALLEAYNAAVGALKEFRDSHIIIVTTYIIGPARRLAEEARSRNPEAVRAGPVGTGGTSPVKFLKGVRDRTQGSLLPGL